MKADRDLIPCYTGWFQTHIKEDGTVIPCGHCYYQVGNLMGKSFSAIWNGPEMRKFRRHGINYKLEDSPLELCGCPNCCQTKDNLRVHHVFKWISPLRYGF